MRHDLARRYFLQRLTAGTGALALAGSATRADAEDKYLASAKLDNFDMYFEEHGDGPPLVLAHGAGGTHISWWQQVPVLSQKYKCITIDHRTFGYSRDVKGGPGRRAFVPDLTGLLDHLGIQKTALVGQSMGGTTVLGFASAHPERVSALIMSDTTGGYTIRKSASCGAGWPRARPVWIALLRRTSPSGNRPARFCIVRSALLPWRTIQRHPRQTARRLPAPTLLRCSTRKFQCSSSWASRISSSRRPSSRPCTRACPGRNW